MRKAGVLGHCGGSGSSGVSALSGWVRSTTRSAPLASCATSSARTLSIRIPLAHFDVALELEAVLQQRQVGDVSFGADRLHLGNDACQLPAGDRVPEGLRELV